MDIVTEKKRSQMMAGIRSKDTKPELYVRKILFKAGYRYRINKNTLGTKPDIILKKWKLCIFVNGCFWHRHLNCKLASFPKSNINFWKKKFEQNVKRDIDNYKKLKNKGWNVGVIWECSVRKGFITENILQKLINSYSSWEI